MVIRPILTEAFSVACPIGIRFWRRMMIFPSRVIGAMYDRRLWVAMAYAIRPRPRVGTGGVCTRSVTTSRLPIGEVPLARDRFSSYRLSFTIVVAAVFSGNCSGFLFKRRSAWHKRPTILITMRASLSAKNSKSP